VRATAVGREGDRTWPWSDLYRLGHLLRLQIGDEDSAISFRRDPYSLAAWLDGDALRFFSDLERLDEMAIARVDHAQLRRIFIRDIDLFTIRADVDLFRIRTGGKHLHQLALSHVHHANAVGASIRWWEFRFVDVGSTDRGSATRDVQERAIRARDDAARALAERDGGHDRAAAGIDDGKVAACFVGDVHANGRRR